MEFIAGHQDRARKLVEALLGPEQARFVRRLVLVLDVEDVVRAYVERFPEAQQVAAAADVALAEGIQPVVTECEAVDVKDGFVQWAPKAAKEDAT